MISLTSATLERISPTRAKELLKQNTLPVQRPIKPRHLANLCDQHEKGLFAVGHIGLVQNGEPEPILANGQHQLNMIIETNKGIQALVERWKVDTPEELATVYGRYDAQGTARNIRDLTHMRAWSLGLEWLPRIESLVVSAATMLTPAGSGMAPTSKVELLKDYIAEGEFIQQVVAGGEGITKNRHMMRRAVAAAMILTFRKCQRDSVAFWTAVRDGDMLPRNSPEFRLRDFLTMHAAEKGSSGKPVQYRASEDEFLHRCINAWNAYRQGKELTILKYLPNKPVPKAL